MMDIKCDYCGHSIDKHMQEGCYAPKRKYVYNTEDEMCECMIPTSTVEARYWGKWAYKQMQAAIWSTNHWMIIAGKQKVEYAELQEQLRMCQLALKTADQAHAELASYTKIAVDALKKIEKARGGVKVGTPGIDERLQAGQNPIAVDGLGHNIDLPSYLSDIASEALDKIKGKF